MRWECSSGLKSASPTGLFEYKMKLSPPGQKKCHPLARFEPKIGAGNEIRTRDPLVGNEMLYH